MIIDLVLHEEKVTEWKSQVMGGNVKVNSFNQGLFVPGNSI